MTTPEEIKAEYASSLADLTFNSKPLINVLTMLAEENSPNAKVIVEAIETHLSKVATDVKLPILYLIDCIVKNIGGTYTTLFSQNIVSTFCSVFKAVDEKTRAEMFKLRQTWNELFPPMKLYAIDVQINFLDPAWPVTAKPPPNSIHLNPKFLKSTPATVKSKMDSSDASQLLTSSTVPGTIDKETLLMQEKLIQKQKELLELQQKKLELEVLQTQVKLQEQIKGSTPIVGLPPTRPQNILLKPEVAKQLVPSALKHKPTGISMSSISQQRNNGSVPKINPVGSALLSAASRPIRDPRLLRQQQKTINNSNANDQLGQKTTILENNKIVTNKTGIRKVRNDPRLVNKDILSHKSDISKSNNINKSRISETVQKSPSKSTRTSPKSGTDSVSLKSSSSSSLDSPIKTKSDKLQKSPIRIKKKDKGDDKKVSPREQKRDKPSKSDSPTTFKGVKTSTKNRNYVRRNLATVSPEPRLDEDLRAFGPPEKQARLQSDSTEEQSNSVSPPKGMDVDLRQLPATIGKKRPSIEAPDQSPAKKSKVEVFDKLFGDEDTDLRQLSMNTDRPPTPPPPIISSSDSPTDTERIDSPKRSLELVRAKLANATNRDKIMSMSFKKKKLDEVEDLDLRVPKVSSTTSVSNKIIISPEDESSIRLGTLTKERESQLLKTIIVQFEKNKLKEAKKKDHEESFNVSLQPISDDELINSDEEKGGVVNITEIPKRESPILKQVPEVNDPTFIPFNDKDERIRPVHMQQKADYMHPPFHPRDIRDIRRNPAPHQHWRGRGGRRHWDNQPLVHSRPPLRPWMNSGPWRNMAPNFPPQRDFVPISQSVQEEAPGSPDQSGDQLTNGAVNQNEIKSMNIDGVPKDIRFYDETAIVFINWDDPREITFQDGVRRVTFNDKDSYVLAFNKPYQEVLINGVPHKVRLGAPSREIFIDEVPFECYFGSAGIRIDLNGVSTTVKLEGPPPQVKIGDVKRTDLVAGKINLFINATIIVPVFLDGKLQKFIIENETSTLKFVNSLKTVLINDVPFTVEYGGLPKPIFIHDKKNFIRFSVLPKGIKPGHINIKDMEIQGSVSPRFDENSQDSMPAVDPNAPALPFIGRVRPKSDSPERNSNSPSFFQNLLQQQSINNLDVLSNVMTPSDETPTSGGYQIENIPVSEDVQMNNFPQVNPPAAIPPALNINELFQKLVASGFVTSVNEQKSTVLPIPQEKPSPTGEPQKPSDASVIPAKPQKRNLLEKLRLITFDKPETLKIRQSRLYASLYGGMQCSSCGMRFSPEASMQYSQHLDWHFRQNRRGKRNTRVATSRKWYYSVSDWKNYEELEDLEEREKNYFDQQQQQAEGGGEDTEEEADIPSVPADPDSTSERCDVCHDKFDQFFHEDKEEWHLRNAIRIDDKTYHPVCYEDYQQSLVDQPVDDSKIEETFEEENEEEPTIPGLEIIIDDDDDEEPTKNISEPTEVVSLESDESKSQTEEPKDESQLLPEEQDDDDDVILNEVAPIKIVVDDDDDDNDNHDEGSVNSQSIKVKEEKMDDGFVEVSGLVSLQNGGQIKIKAEPVDPDEINRENREQRNLGPIPEADKSIEEVEFVTRKPTELVTSIDGNIEIVETPTTSAPTSGISGTKIKLNISKPLPVIPTKEKGSESEFPTDTYIDPSEPFPPGEEPEPVKLKPALQAVNLKKLPTVKKGNELTGLCSIM